MLSQIFEFFRRLLDTSDWPARWHCGRWTDFHGWLYIVSDLLIWSAYFAIPVIILAYMRRKELAFPRLYALFATFILACGLTHFLDALIFWVPVYRLSALVRFGTGVVSWVTALSLVQLLPVAFSQRTQKELEREIEQRKAAEAALRENNRLLNEAQQLGRIGHWERDLTDGGQHVTGSQQFFQLFGFPYTPHPLRFAEVIERIHPEDRAYVLATSERGLTDGHIPPIYYRVVRPDGSVVQLFARAEALTDGQGGAYTKMVGVVQDVTQLRAMENELLQKTRELESRVSDLQRFAFIASHDLKEPLRKIGMFASILESQHGRELSGKGPEYLGKIMDSARRNQQLIEELLTFSRLGNEKAQFVRANLADLAHEAVADLEVLRHEAQAEITIDPLPDAEVVPVQIRLLFQNLLANALKFRRPGVPSRIHVRSELVGLEGSGLGTHLTEHYSVLGNPRYWDNLKFVKLYIQDNGIGFEEEYRHQIFEIFRRVHSSHAYDGTGLGLAICKKIVENHHGIIEADGRPNEGATFIVTLPLSQWTFE